MARYLLAPCNNTLSHVAKCLALRAELRARGHEVFLAVSQARAAFLDRIGEQDWFILPDLQEADGGAMPAFSWFRPQRFEACVRAELALLRDLHPDAMLGVFRFTGPISARLAGVPYDALICGAMTPACPDVLGFAPGEPGASEQAAALDFFRRACARRIAPALSELGLDPVADAWQLLEGRRTFLWDFPEFQPLPETPGYHHVGPLLWPDWPRPDHDQEALTRLRGPVAYVAFGTGRVPPGTRRHLVETLWHLGYAVALALGGQAPANDLPVAPERLAAFEFLPAERILAMASLVVCHGGQNLIFEALRQQVPVFVLPLQPEQAQNGVCVERLGCGRRLLRGQVYSGHADDIEAACLARPVEALAVEIATCLADPGTPGRLAQAASLLGRHQGAAALAEAMA